MNKWQALDTFWNSFGIPAYDESSVPQDATMPYITYSVAVSGFEDVVFLSASVWYRDTKWREISLKVDQISQRLETNKLIKIDGEQYLFLSKGSPFAQRMLDNDDSVRRVYINVSAEYFSRN